MQDPEKSPSALEEGRSSAIVPASPQSTLCPQTPLTSISTVNDQQCNAQYSLRKVWKTLRAAFSSPQNVPVNAGSDLASRGDEKHCETPQPEPESEPVDLVVGSAARGKSSSSLLKVRDLDRFKKGYPNLAAFANSHENFMLYRRFGYLQSRMLLGKQDELRRLEEQLDALDEFDMDSEAEDADFERLWSCKDQGDDRETLMKQIEDKFCEYSRIMAAAQQLVSLNRPTSSEHSSVMNYMNNNKVVQKEDASYVLWKEDLVTLRRGDYALLDSAIEKTLRWFHCPLIEYCFCSEETKRISKDEKNVYYTRERIAACVLGIIMLIILFLLIVPTYALFHLSAGGFQTRGANSLCIGILLIFTLLFSAVVSLFTDAKRHEILGAAAAYCAVLVVFLGNVGNFSGGSAMNAVEAPVGIIADGHQWPSGEVWRLCKNKDVKIVVIVETLRSKGRKAVPAT